MRFSVIHAFIATALVSTASAGLASAQRAADVAGFHFGGGLNATSIKLDETGFTDDERENGLGLNAYVGYNFTRNFGLTLGVTGASIDDDQTDDFSVAHVDLTGRASFPGNSAFVPYLELALTAMATEFDTNGQEVELQGGGIGAGLGFNYFFTRRAAFDASFRYTMGEFSDIEINGVNAGDVDEVEVNTTRLNIGFAFYP
jgi:hypothetical protein